MPSAKTLIDQLASEGRVVKSGAFTLDREKAREKLRKFQLADPRQYVLQLVQAATLKGATSIRFDIDADEMSVAFDGRPFSMEELENLYAAMFTRGAAPDLKAQRQLALGLNAAMALNPSRVDVHSGTARLEMRHGKPDKLEEGKAGAEVTRIYLRERFRPGHVVEFFTDIAGTLAEERFLIERCLYSRSKIVLDGNAISRGFDIPDAVALCAINTPDVRGAAGLVRGRDPELRLVTDGVWVTTHPLPKAINGFVVVVEGDLLSKDVSQADIIRDAQYDKMLGTVRHAENVVLAELAGSEPVRRTDWAVRLLKQALGRIKSRDVLQSSSQARRVALAPLWEDARGPRALITGKEADQGALLSISLADLVKRFGDLGHVPFARSAVTELEPDPEAPVPLITSAQDVNHLERLFDGETKNIVRTLRNQVARERNRLRFQSRKAKPKLSPFQPHLASAPIEAEGVVGEIGITGLKGPSSRITFIKDGCLLAAKTYQLPVSGLDIAFEASFTPTSKYDGVRASVALFNAAMAAGAALPALTESLADSYRGWPRSFWGDTESYAGWVEAYLDFVLAPNAASRWLEGFDISTKAARSAARRFPDVRLHPRLHVGNERLDAKAAPHRLAEVPLFPTLDGKRLSLVDVEKTLGSSGRLRYVGDTLLLSPNVRPKGVAQLTDRARRILRQLFGRKALDNYEKEYEQKRLASLHHRKDSELPELELRGVVAQRFSTDDGISGEVAFLDPDTRRKARASQQGWECRLRLLKNNRLLAHTGLNLPVGPLIGVANSDSLTPTPNWKGVIADDELEAVNSAVTEAGKKALRKLCTTFMRRAPGPQPQSRRLLLECVLRLLTPNSPAWADANLVEALEKLPLFEVHGGKPTSLAQLRAYHQAHGVLHYLREQTSSAAVGERTLIILPDAERALIEDLFGDGSVEESSDWLRMQHSRKTFEQQPRRRLFVPRRVLVSCPIGGDEVEGVVGLANVHEGSDASMEIEACTDGRPAGTIRSRGSFALRAVLNDAKLPLTPQFTLDHDHPRVQHLRDLCSSRMPELMALLSERWSKLKRAEQMWGWNHVLDFLTLNAGDLIELSGEREKAAVTFFRSLKRFRGADDRLYCLDELRAARDAIGFVPYLTTPIRGKPLDPNMVAVIPSAYELGALRRLVAPLREYDDEWREEQEGVLRRDRARRLRAAAPEDALATRTFKVSGIEGVVWLPAGQVGTFEVAFGRDGKEVERRVASEAFHCCGVVQGDGLDIDRRWLKAELNKKQRRSLERRARMLYTDLYDQWDNRAELPEKRRKAIQSNLREAVLRLHRLIGAKGGPAVSSAAVRFYRRARHLELIWLRDGRMVSLDKILSERPVELELMGLWDRAKTPPSAQPNRPLRRSAAAAPRRKAAPGARAVSAAQEQETALATALLAELRWARDKHSDLLSDINIERLRFSDQRSKAAARCGADGVVLFRRHPVVTAALKDPTTDPVVLTFLASAVYSALNLYWSEITDDHERSFHQALTDHALTAYADA